MAGLSGLQKNNFVLTTIVLHVNDDAFGLDSNYIWLCRVLARGI